MILSTDCTDFHGFGFLNPCILRNPYLFNNHAVCFETLLFFNYSYISKHKLSISLMRANLFLAIFAPHLKNPMSRWHKLNLSAS